MKIKWYVSKAETGLRRAVYQRSWPVAYYGDQDGDWAARIKCEDSYSPNRARHGDHAPLTLLIADYSVDPFVWKKVKKTFKTLAEAKEALEKLLDKYPYFRPDAEVLI